MANKFKLYAICYNNSIGHMGTHERYMLEDEVIDWLTINLTRVISKQWQDQLDKSTFYANSEITVISELAYDESRWNITKEVIQK